jgi:hypothetical protein
MSHLARVPEHTRLPVIATPADDVATAEERAVLVQLGERAACAELLLPRSTLARIASGWRVRHSTLLVFRWRLEEWRTREAAKDQAAKERIAK